MIQIFNPMISIPRVVLRRRKGTKMKKGLKHVQVHKFGKQKICILRLDSQRMEGFETGSAASKPANWDYSWLLILYNKQLPTRTFRHFTQQNLETTRQPLQRM